MASRAELSIFLGTGLGSGFFSSSELFFLKKVTNLPGFYCAGFGGSAVTCCFSNGFISFFGIIGSCFTYMGDEGFTISGFLTTSMTGTFYFISFCKFTGFVSAGFEDID